jgi:hypothetical protein
MKKLILILLVVTGFYQMIAQEKNSVVVGFYNLENLFDTINDPKISDDEFTPDGANAYTGKVFKKKIENLSSVISIMGKDYSKDGLAFLGVAEIENRSVLEALCAAPSLRDRNWKIVHFDGPDQRGIDCALLYNPSLFRVLESESLTVPVEVGDRPTRDVLHVYGKLMGEPVHVFVNHWPSRSGGEAATREKRNLAASVNKKVIDSLMKIDPMTKVIVMGDLNDDPINESITKVLATEWKTDKLKPGGLFNPWTTFYKKGLGTMAYRDTWGLFDQIMISYGFVKKSTKGLHFDHAEVFFKPFMVEKFGQYRGYPKRSYSNGVWNDGYSDHCPTLIVLD